MAASTRLIKPTWTPLRNKALPLSAPETDWRATNDVAGFKAAHASGLYTIIPKGDSFGAFQMNVEYLDAAGGLIIPAANSRVVVEFLELSELAAFDGTNINAKVILIKGSDDITLQGEQLVGAVIGTFRQVIGIRFISTQSEPGGATQMAVSARYA